MIRRSIEGVMRDLGASGRFKGFWMTLDIVETRLKGKTAGQAIREVAEKEGIYPGLAHERIRLMIRYMEKQGMEQYKVLWGNGRKPTPSELIDRLADMVKKG